MATKLKPKGVRVKRFTVPFMVRLSERQIQAIDEMRMTSFSPMSRPEFVRRALDRELAGGRRR